MRLSDPLLAFLVVTLVIIAVTVLTLAGREIPDVLPALGLFAAGVGGGAALPRVRPGGTP